MHQGSSSSSDAIIQALAILAIVGGVSSVLSRRQSVTGTMLGNDAQESKRLKMVHNEQVRMDSNFLFSCATAVVMAGGFAPIIGAFAWYLQHQQKYQEALLATGAAAVFGLFVVCFAGWLKGRARKLLAGLKALD